LSNKYNKYIDDIVKYKGEAKGSRAIAKILGISKSSVNNFFNRYLESKDEVEGNLTLNDDCGEYTVNVAKVADSEDKSEDVVTLAKSVRRYQKENTMLRKIQRDMFDSQADMSELTNAISDACNNAIKFKSNRTINKISTIEIGAERLTVEVLFSDWQIGKTMSGYDSGIAVNRLEYYTEQVLMAIEDKIEQGYVIDKIILGMLGDIIESDMKHSNSAQACDNSTSEQIKLAIEHLSTGLVEPIAQLGFPVDCVMITGNHDWDGNGLNMYKPGRTHLSYPMYFAVQEIIKAKGYSNVSFVIPEGSFYTTEIYGMGVLYEHGVGVSTSEAAMSKRKMQRSEQLRKHLTYFRMGDKHNISRFNEDTYIVNGAFFGGDKEGTDYSSISGYSSDPAQLIVFHTPREDDRLTVCDSKTIQLIHIK